MGAVGGLSNKKLFLAKSVPHEQWRREGVGAFSVASMSRLILDPDVHVQSETETVSLYIHT